MYDDNGKIREDVALIVGNLHRLSSADSVLHEDKKYLTFVEEAYELGRADQKKLMSQYVDDVYNTQTDIADLAFSSIERLSETQKRYVRTRKQLFNLECKSL